MDDVRQVLEKREERLGTYWKWLLSLDRTGIFTRIFPSGIFTRLFPSGILNWTCPSHVLADGDGSSDFALLALNISYCPILYKPSLIALKI